LEPIRQVCVYAHEDSRLRERLHEQLSLLRKLKLIAHWWDREIGPGDEWQGVVDKHLNTAQIILLLVSPSFLESRYCYDIEARVALKRHRANKCKVIPVILRPCTWELAPFGKLQALPEGAKPVVMWRPQDLGFKSVVGGVHRAVLEMRGQ
jgi:hypothetical protein